MRLIINAIDGLIVLDGAPRKVDLPAVERLQHLSWDGTVGIVTYADSDPVYFDTEDVVLPYRDAWENAPEPEPPPLPPWEDEPELPMPLPRFAIPVPPFEPFPEAQPPLPFDAPPPKGQEKLVSPWAATEEELAAEMARLQEEGKVP